MESFFKMIGVFTLSVFIGAIVAMVFLLKRIIKIFRQTMRSVSDTKTAGQTYEEKRRAGKDGEVMIDRQTAQRMNRKIFDKNEGEYVDYTEEV